MPAVIIEVGIDLINAIFLRIPMVSLHLKMGADHLLGKYEARFI
jgi:hypothetical protein